MVRQVSELNDIPITFGSGPPIYVRDVAEVKDANQIQSNIVRVNGKRQVYIPIYRQPGANTIAVVEGIRAALKPILERIKGINLDIVMDQSVYVRQAIRNVANEGVLGASLAALMVWIFLKNTRPMAIVLIALPLACLGAFIGLYFTRDTLNIMTLGGLALSLAKLLDESIVVLENTARHLALGKPPLQAALDGASEVARPLTIVTVTVSVVFFPVVFLTGLGKFLFTPLAKTVIFAIVTSRLLAVTVVPLCASRFLRAEHHTEAGWFIRLRDRYQNLLRYGLRRRWLLLAGTAVLFAGSMLLFKFVGTELFPQTDVGQFMIRMRGPTGLRVERTDELIAKVEDVLRGVIPDGERQMLISNIGILYDWPAAYTPNSGSGDAFILVQLARHHRRSSFEYVNELRDKLPREFPGVEFNFDTGGL